MKGMYKTIAAVIAVSLMLAAAGAWAQAQEIPPEWGISSEEFNQAVEKIKEEEPYFYAALLEIRKEDEMYYTDLVADWIFTQRELDELKEFEPELYRQYKKMAELEKEERSLSGQYRTAKTKAEKQAVDKKLRTLLDKLFDEKLKLQKQELKQLEKELSEIKSDIERREQNKERIIEHRLADLKGEDEMYEW